MLVMFTVSSRRWRDYGLIIGCRTRGSSSYVIKAATATIPDLSRTTLGLGAGGGVRDRRGNPRSPSTALHWRIEILKKSLKEFYLAIFDNFFCQESPVQNYLSFLGVLFSAWHLSSGLHLLPPIGEGGGLDGPPLPASLWTLFLSWGVDGKHLLSLFWAIEY